MIGLPVFSGTLGFLGILIGLGFVIFVHELGHFLVAKWAGIRCDQFAVGFGHAAVAWRKGIGFRRGTTTPEMEKRVIEYLKEKDDASVKLQEKAEGQKEIDPAQLDRVCAELGIGETEYRLNWIPLGGYVKMLGQEDLNPAATSDYDRAYNKKPIWARMCVVSAGVIMNMIFAVIFFVAAFLIGVNFPPPIVGITQTGSPAATTAPNEKPNEYGLKPGDRIREVNGTRPVDFADVMFSIALADPNELIIMHVDRPGATPEQTERLTFELDRQVNEQMGLKLVGMERSASLNVVPDIGENATALKNAGLWDDGFRPGYRITAVNGQPVTEYYQYHRALTDAAGEPITLTLVPQKNAESDPSEKITATIAANPRTETLDIGGPRPLPHVLGLVPATRIDRLTDDSASKGKLRPGDVIAELEGEPWPSLTQVVQLIQSADGAVAIEVLRDGQNKAYEITPKGGRLGIGLTVSPYVSRVLDESPFANPDWQWPEGGVRITSVDGREIKGFDDLRIALEQAGPGQIDFEYVIPGADPETATTTLTDDHHQRLAALGWDDPLYPYLIEMQEPQKASGPVEAVAMGWRKTVQFGGSVYLTIARLFQGSVQIKSLSGPVGIAVMGTRVSQRGIPYLLFFLGVISVSLAVINFLPLPIVDGGLFVLLIVEKLRGKPVPARAQEIITWVGIVMLGTLFIVVTYNDIVNHVL